MQQATVNVLADMGAQPVTLMAGLTAATASTDTTAPTATITSPAAGAAIANGTLVTATGTAADVGGLVAGVEVSTDGGTSWHPASGTTSWTYTYVQHGNGTTPLRARAVDDSANIGSAASIDLTVACPCSVFGAQMPATPAADDTDAYELGLRFSPAEDGFVTGIRFYKGTGNGGTHNGTLWSPTGTALAQLTFTGETATGWQQATFSTPVAVAAGSTYTVSYTAAQGHYAFAAHAFDAASLQAPPLSVPGGFGVAPGGVYGNPGSYPVVSSDASNYFVDVIFDTVNSSPLTVSSRRPLDGATSVGVGSTVSAVFSKPIQTGSASLTLTAAGGAAVAGTTAYDVGTRQVTFTPSADLAVATVYTAQVAALDAQGGGAVQGSTSWTFTTAASGQAGGTVSFYDDASTPSTLEATDTSPVTLGVRFASSVAGTVEAIKFYKGPTNTGTHVGSLWRVSDGALLATVTFAGESTTGWQLAALSSPVTIEADTEYIASYFAPAGRYSATINAFLGAGIQHDPLRTVSDSGAYTYGVANAYPATTTSTSYYVDVVFRPASTGLPTVSSLSPAAGATGVATTATVSGVLSAAPASGTPVLAVSTPAGGVAGSSAYDPVTRTVLFTPSAALPAGVVVSAAVSLDGTALTGGSWSFTTAAPPVLPTVSSLSPAAGATGVATTATVSGVLSAAPASGTPVLAVSTPAGGVAGSSAYDPVTRTVLFTPSAALPAGVVVSAAVSLDGTALTGGSWSFTTAAPPVLPTVSSLSPAAGATGVATTATVSGVLSAAPASGTPVLAVSTPAGGVAGSSAYDPVTRTVLFTPSAALPAGVVVSAAVSLDGTALTGGSWSFTTAAPPTQSQIERYIVRVYRDLFNRGVDPTGLRTWTAALESGTPRVAVANAITGSREYRSRLIQGAYRTYLGREAESAGLENWLARMQTGLTITDLEAGFLASDEYYKKSGSDDAEWVRRLYQAVLGRSASAAEVAHWVEQERLFGRVSVARGFLLSSEHLTTVINGYYLSLLGRSIDPTGRATWVTSIQRGVRLEAVIGSIIASEEYFGKA